MFQAERNDSTFSTVNVTFLTSNCIEHSDVENKTVFYKEHRAFLGKKEIKINETIMPGLENSTVCHLNFVV